MLKSPVLGVVLGGALLLGACETYGPGYGPEYGYGGPPPVGESTAAGAGIGALGGCILAEATDGSCLTGAALGAVVGGAIGYYRDRECREGYCGERDNVRVYYDNRCAAYYYIDRDGRQYWEGGGRRRAGCPGRYR